MLGIVRAFRGGITLSEALELPEAYRQVLVDEAQKIMAKETIQQLTIAGSPYMDSTVKSKMLFQLRGAAGEFDELIDSED